MEILQNSNKTRLFWFMHKPKKKLHPPSQTHRKTVLLSLTLLSSDSGLTFLKYSSSKEILAVPDCLTPDP